MATTSSLRVDAQVAELAAHFEAGFLVKADGMGGLVHPSTVRGCQHVTAQTRMYGGCTNKTQKSRGLVKMH